MQRFGRTVGVALTAVTLYGCGGGEDPKEANAPHKDVVPEGGVKFYGMEKGACCCVEADRITSKEECHTALEDVMAEMIALGRTKDEEKMDAIGWEGENNETVPGCSFQVMPDGKTGRGNWNTASTGKAADDHIPICQEHFSRLSDDTIPNMRAGGLTVALAVSFSSLLLLGVLGAVVAVRRGSSWREIRLEMEDLPDVKLMPEDEELPDGI